METTNTPGAQPGPLQGKVSSKHGCEYSCLPLRSATSASLLKPRGGTLGGGADAELCSLEKQGCVNTGYWQKGPNLARPGVLWNLTYSKDLLSVPHQGSQIRGSRPADPGTHYRHAQKSIYSIFASQSQPSPPTSSVNPVPFSTPHTSFKVWLPASPEHNRWRSL